MLASLGPQVILILYNFSLIKSTKYLKSYKEYDIIVYYSNKYIFYNW